ncbi:MAG: hypothetical protein QME94_06735 [Anaerolineae bacterium]|nr:hypothetical protein [Anaerolineae bacterium]
MPASRGRTIVGAIRWDAWFGDKGVPGMAVERSLGPKHWHYRLPFYAVEVSDSQVLVRADTQEIMDQEIAYAAAAGLDYWAFVTYEPDDPMSLGLKLYLASAHRHKINFCLNLLGGHLRNPDGWLAKVERFVGYFREPAYQTVLDGRPLVYLFMAEAMVGDGGFASWQAAREAIGRLREAAVAAGIATPYLVIQDWSFSTAKKCLEQLGADAIGAYASNGGGKHAPYADLAGHTERTWDTMRWMRQKAVPLVTAGWDRRPRVENPVPWEKGLGGTMDEYYEPPRPEELAAHLQAALDWVARYPETAEANAILIYAWNEVDEGGWLVPTLAEGTARLDAIGKVLEGRRGS